MGAARIITVEVPEDLLERAQKASGQDVAETVRKGLQLVASSSVYEELRKWRGKVKLTETLEELKGEE